MIHHWRKQTRKNNLLSFTGSTSSFSSQLSPSPKLFPKPNVREGGGGVEDLRNTLLGICTDILTQGIKISNHYNDKYFKLFFPFKEEHIKLTKNFIIFPARNLNRILSFLQEKELVLRFYKIIK